MKTKTNTNDQMNQITTTEIMNENTTANVMPAVSTTDGTNENAERLTQLATKIRTAYNERHKSEGKVEDWKAKQLKAGIELGEYLLEAKKLADKKFMAWCRDNFPELCHRTLNRYMTIAVNKCETHVAKAGGLRKAYKACAKDQQTDAPEKAGFSKDAAVIKRHLMKVLKCLNSYSDLIACEEADAICDLVDALNIWSTDYRDRTNRQSLNKHRDAEFEMRLADDKEAPTSSQGTEFVTTE